VLPSIDLRIANLIKALEQVIVPALPAGERLARDQAMLVIGHLSMIRQQWQLALRFEVVALEGLVGLAGTLAEVLGEQARTRLREAASAADQTDRSNLAAVEEAYTRLGTVIDAEIIGADHAAPLCQAAMDAILDFGERQARRERTWFKSNSLDPDRAELPAIEDALQ